MWSTSASGQVLALAVVLLVVGSRAHGHASCVHDKKAIRLPTKSTQRRREGAGLRAAHPDNTRPDFAPLRIHFDWTHVENNGETYQQQQYVKGLVERSGKWLSSALCVRREPGNLRFETASEGTSRSVKHQAHEQEHARLRLAQRKGIKKPSGYRNKRAHARRLQ